MSVTLTTEQFSALIDATTSASKKKFSKTDLKQRTNAINLEQFINQFQYQSVSTLTSMEMPDFVVHSILANLQQLEDEERPFICSNHQTKSFYYKSAVNNNEWVKGNDFIHKLYSKIYKDASAQIINRHNAIVNDDESDDDVIERKYETSQHCNTQNILRNLCNCDKYPYAKAIDKVLSKLGKSIKE